MYVSSKISLIKHTSNKYTDKLTKGFGQIKGEREKNAPKCFSCWSDCYFFPALFGAFELYKDFTEPNDF